MSTYSSGLTAQQRPDGPSIDDELDLARARVRTLRHFAANGYVDPQVANLLAHAVIPILTDLFDRSAIESWADFAKLQVTAARAINAAATPAPGALR